MNPHNGASAESDVITAPIAFQDTEQRAERIGLGGERRGSHSEAWAVRNRLRCTSVESADEQGRVDCGRRSTSAYRLVFSCDLEILDETH